MLRSWSRFNLFNFLNHFLFSNFLPKCSLGSICLKCCHRIQFQYHDDALQRWRDRQPYFWRSWASARRGRSWRGRGRWRRRERRGCSRTGKPGSSRHRRWPPSPRLGGSSSRFSLEPGESLHGWLNWNKTLMKWVHMGWRPFDKRMTEKNNFCLVNSHFNLGLKSWLVSLVPECVRSSTGLQILKENHINSKRNNIDRERNVNDLLLFVNDWLNLQVNSLVLYL